MCYLHLLENEKGIKIRGKNEKEVKNHKGCSNVHIFIRRVSIKSLSQ